VKVPKSAEITLYLRHDGSAEKPLKVSRILLNPCRNSLFQFSRVIAGLMSTDGKIVGR